MEYKVEFIQTSDLKPYKKNAKRHPKEQIDKIAESIRQFGFRQNLVIDDDNCVVIGHGRLLAAQKLGIEEVPCLRVGDLTEEQIRALRLADNKVAESDWNKELLSEELGDISDIDMSMFGFSDDDLITALDLDDDDEKSAGEDGEDQAETLKCPKCGFVFEVR